MLECFSEQTRSSQNPEKSSPKKTEPLQKYPKPAGNGTGRRPLKAPKLKQNRRNGSSRLKMSRKKLKMAFSKMSCFRDSKTSEEAPYDYEKRFSLTENIFQKERVEKDLTEKMLHSP